jgi:hypothetical protein
MEKGLQRVAVALFATCALALVLPADSGVASPGPAPQAGVLAGRCRTVMG